MQSPTNERTFHQFRWKLEGHSQWDGCIGIVARWQPMRGPLMHGDKAWEHTIEELCVQIQETETSETLMIKLQNQKSNEKDLCDRNLEYS